LHDFKIASQILESVLMMAEQNRATKVKSVYLTIGPIDFLSDIRPEIIQSSFDLISEGTIAEGAQLEIDEVDLLAAGKKGFVQKKDEMEQYFPFDDGVIVKGILIERENNQPE
jgi:Zn finger protein HypA/HybF involved in hydrogenase expression